MERHVINLVTAVVRARNEIRRKQHPVVKTIYETMTLITNYQSLPKDARELFAVLEKYKRG